jgi:transposase
VSLPESRLARSKHHRGTTMKHYAGIDVSLNSSSVCVVDESGKIVREVKVASEPVALIHCIKSLGVRVERIGLEAGPLSQWLYGALRESGLPVELLETRHVKAALSAMPVKTDRNDARGLAQLMRLGWFRPVHCKTMAAQEVRALLTARKLVQSKLYDIEMSLRGILRGFGLKVGPTTSRSFAARINHLAAASEPGNGSGSTAFDACGGAVRVQEPGEDRATDQSRRRAGSAVDVDARGWPSGRAHLHFRDRRPDAFHLVEAGGGAFWAHAEEVSVRRNRHQRSN